MFYFNKVIWISLRKSCLYKDKLKKYFLSFHSGCKYIYSLLKIIFNKIVEKTTKISKDILDSKSDFFYQKYKMSTISVITLFFILNYQLICLTNILSAFSEPFLNAKMIFSSQELSFGLEELFLKVDLFKMTLLII